MKRNDAMRSGNNVVSSGNDHSSDQMPIGGNSMKKKNVSFSSTNTVSSVTSHSFRPLVIRREDMENALPLVNSERKTATLEFNLERELTTDELEKIRVNAILIVSDWGSYKPTLSVAAIGKQVLVKIEGHLPEDSREFLTFWEGMISDVVAETVREGAKNEIAYETFAKSFLKPEILIKNLKQIIAKIYNLETNTISADYEVRSNDGMIAYRFEFWETTVKNHEQNLAKLIAADEAMVMRLELEAFAA